MTAVEITTSHSPADWRDAHEDSVPGAELDRIRARVAAARNRGENDAVVAVVLSEASEWRERALAAEARLAAGIALHQPGIVGTWCQVDALDSPCPTVRALQGES